MPRVPADLKGVSKRRADEAAAVPGHELVLLVVQHAHVQGQGQDEVRTTTQTVLLYSVSWSRLLMAVRAPRADQHDSNNTYVLLYDVPEGAAGGDGGGGAAAAGQAGGRQLMGSPLHGATDGACQVAVLPSGMGVSPERGLQLAHALLRRWGQQPGQQGRAIDLAWRPLLHFAAQGPQPGV